jgi:hypothetical protein
VAGELADVNRRVDCLHIYTYRVPIRRDDAGDETGCVAEAERRSVTFGVGGYERRPACGVFVQGQMVRLDPGVKCESGSQERMRRDIVPPIGIAKDPAAPAAFIRGEDVQRGVDVVRIQRVRPAVVCAGDRTMTRPQAHVRRALMMRYSHAPERICS